MSIVSITILLLVVSFSYAYIKLNKEEREVNILGTDCIKLEMKEESEGITLHHAYPVTDETGQASTPYTFKLTNECGVGVDYEIHLRVENVEEGQNQIEASNIATSVDGNNKVKLTNRVTNEEEQDKEEYKISNKLSLKPYEEVEHKVRIWLDKDAGNETQNGIFKSKVVIEAIQNQTAIYIEKILNGADPVLYDTKEEPLAMLTASDVEPTITDTLVPITIDTEGNVKKADVTTEWYNYEKKEWANAVILVDNEKAKTLKAGDKIEENEIESYFVWIPKYRYKIFDMGNYENANGPLEENAEQPIEIEFGLENTIDDATNENYKQCATPNKSGADGNCHVGDWMTHPAFTAFENSKGFWVGKFETGYNQSTEENQKTITVDNSWTEPKAQKDENDSTKVIIKPNVYSWRNITVGNAFKTSYEYERDLDSHMMKNTEWGAVAYLSHSKYGTCENDKCSEIRINNNHYFVTGYAASKEPTIGYTGKSENGNEYERVVPNQNGTYGYHYGNSNSVVASTTWNYTGIYDMSGGAWEYMASPMTNSNNPTSASEISFKDSELEKEDIPNLSYVDLYAIGEETEYKRRILGDATGEMGPFKQVTYDSQDRKIGSWHSDEAWFVNSANLWFSRGGFFMSGIGDGVFTFGHDAGKSNTSLGFRIVLTPTNEAM